MRTIQSKVLTFLMWAALALTPNAAFSDTPEAQSIAAFVDETLGAFSDQDGVLGLTLAVVSPNEGTILRGVGTADVRSGEPVDPEKHLFQIASLSKTFVGVAIMQLAEQGLVDIDADIRTYLPNLPISETFNEPIRVRDLLAHRTGFEISQSGLWHMTPEGVPTLSEYIQDYAPQRVWRPGELTAYSNYGYSLAGRIVEVASGMPFQDYLEAKIFLPLNMTSTTARTPEDIGRGVMRAELQKRLTPGHRSLAAGAAHRGFVYTPSAPAAGVVTTAKDMALYMKAHLNDGAGETARIMLPETAKKMRARVYTDRPFEPDFAHGIEVRPYGDVKVVEHEGDMIYTMSLMAIAPDAGIGVFVSINTSDGTEMNREITTEIIQFATALVEKSNPARNQIKDAAPMDAPP